MASLESELANTKLLEELELQPPTIVVLESQQQENFKEIERFGASELSYTDFYWRYMHRNWPVILTNVSTDWECRRNWTQVSSNQPTNIVNQPTNQQTYTAINFDYLKSSIGDRQVPIADCNTEYYNCHAKCDMNFFDFLTLWNQKITAETNRNEISTTTNKSKNLYLKDWHLKTAMPNYDFYRVPKHFASDWLNEHLVANERDDYRFVYMGPKDTWTPFHADVFGSFSWSTNIVGCKKWLLLPPGEEVKLADRLGNLPFRIDEELLQQHDVCFYTLLQSDNQAIFVPSGWYHQVWNLTDTISVNHNWFNACNVTSIWHNLQINMKNVIAEIEDCRQMDNFEEHCQLMLRASFGINYIDFIELLEYIAAQRLAAIDKHSNGGCTSSNVVIFYTYILNDYHVHHDLNCIRQVLNDMLQDSIICDSRTVLYRRCVCLSEQLKEATI